MLCNCVTGTWCLLDFYGGDVAHGRATDAAFTLTHCSWILIMDDLDLRTAIPPADPLPFLPECSEPVAPSSAPRRTSRLRELINRRALQDWSPQGILKTNVAASEPFWRWVHDYYFRVEASGWERLPPGNSMLIGVHAGTWLPMDAWMLVLTWWLRFGEARQLHGTCHDVLMALPGMREFFRRWGVVPAARDSVNGCLAAGHSVAIWPGGEVDAMRAWKKRGEVVLGGRRGFVRQAIQAGVPIVPVATVGGAETVFVLSEGRWLAEKLQLKRFLRSEVAPIVAGLPFGLWLEVLPSHLPLPAKLRYEFLEPVPVGDDPERAGDAAYVERLYKEVESRLQAGVQKLMRERRLPILG
jgi:1-acyl-sn-glycerol-3-phosphate acyltransferase